jgi:hypothetical protein
MNNGNAFTNPFLGNPNTGNRPQNQSKIISKYKIYLQDQRAQQAVQPYPATHSK